MKITVAICTWNRAPLLARALDAMTRLRVPGGVDWELLVVNNHCTDDTDQVIASYLKRLPLRRLWEPRPGKSNACNLAVREAAGEYMLWIDDDVLVDPEWLAAYCRAFRHWPGAAVFAGRIDPWFPGTPPNWLSVVFPKVAAAFASLNLGEEELPLGGDRLPYGANMAIRTTEQRLHLYDPLMGPEKDVRKLGEETAVVCSILTAGGQGRWVPDARVRHYIPPERQSVRYLREYYFAYGRGRAREIDVVDGPTWFGRPRWLWRHAVEWELRYRARRICSPPTQWVEALIHANTARGMLRDWKQAREHRKALAIEMAH